MKVLRRHWLWLLLLCVVGVLALRPWVSEPPNLEHAIGLLVPDRQSAGLLFEVWERAAAEQGVPLRLVSDKELLNDGFSGRRDYEALILPDTVHQYVSPALATALESYVRRGGHLLLGFDAGTRGADGNYLASGARLSALAGVSYGLYDTLAGLSTGSGQVFASAATAMRLGLPPGKTELDPAALSGMNRHLATYGYGALRYPYFVTKGHFEGEPLLQTGDGSLVVGIHRVGRGEVLFVNLPLGKLKAETDGWLLHRVLKLFAERAVMPLLAMTPEAVGGMVMNVHVDSRAALQPLSKLLDDGFFKNGPASVHVTAGPDVNREGDGMGLNVDDSTDVQNLLRRFEALGHSIGSHGGWIHNRWGVEVGPNTEAQHAVLIERNNRSLAKVLRHPVVEFSAPVGNHPAWVTDWLQKHGAKAYYTTANSGAAPGRMYRNGRLEDESIWSFPVASLGAVAAFEEAHAAGMTEDADILPWLEASTRFVADQREVRLIYFHPPGVQFYPQAARRWVESANALQRQGRFRWYTMSDIARFLDRREAVHWRVVHDAVDERLEAEQVQSLKDMSWLFPVSRYAQPKLKHGNARIFRSGSDWVVVAGECRELRLALPLEVATSFNVSSKEISK